MPYTLTSISKIYVQDTYRQYTTSQRRAEQMCQENQNAQYYEYRKGNYVVTFPARFIVELRVNDKKSCYMDLWQHRIDLIRFWFEGAANATPERINFLKTNLDDKTRFAFFLNPETCDCKLVMFNNIINSGLLLKYKLISFTPFEFFTRFSLR